MEIVRTMQKKVTKSKAKKLANKIKTERRFNFCCFRY